MMHLLRLLTAWSVRRLLLFAVIVAALVALVKVKEAYDRVPVLRGEIEALERQQDELGRAASREIRRAAGAVEEIEQLELTLLQQRLAEVRARIAAAGGARFSRSRFALDVVRGDTDSIARELAASFRLQLLRREEAAIAARIEMIRRGDHVRSLGERIEALDARIAALEREIAEIERRYPLAKPVATVPLVRELSGPWQALAERRQALAAARAERARTVQARQASNAVLGRARSVYAQNRAAILEAVPPDGELRQRIEDRRRELSRHWASRAWEAVRPVLGWALWLTLLVILAPPAIKAFWFFVVAPAAGRLAPVRVCAGRRGEARWADGRVADGGTGSAVSRRILLRPGEELLVRPDYLQSSEAGAVIDSQLLLSAAIPFGSLATGLVGLTRIRAAHETSATVSATKDVLDEVAVIEIADGSSLVFKPRSLVGLVQPSARPMRLERVWRLGSLSSWLTLQLRHLLFHGPCALIVKGARGVALEPAEGGRRVSDAATLGWSAGLDWSVRRSETFLAYLTGKQSLFIDTFEGEGGKVVYEELPRAGRRGGLFGRGLEGIGDAMLKVVGL
jgi:prefoldin subunit 5